VFSVEVSQGVTTQQGRQALTCGHAVYTDWGYIIRYNPKKNLAKPQSQIPHIYFRLRNRFPESLFGNSILLYSVLKIVIYSTVFSVSVL
jgi:hypothetical protein